MLGSAEEDKLTRVGVVNAGFAGTRASQSQNAIEVCSENNWVT